MKNKIGNQNYGFDKIKDPKVHLNLFTFRKLTFYFKYFIF